MVFSPPGGPGRPRFWPGRRAFRVPHRLAFYRIIVQGLGQAGKHIRRSLEQRLGLRFRDFFNVRAQMVDKLTQLSLEFLHVVNRIVPGNGFHASDAFLEAWLFFAWFRPFLLPG